MPTRGTGLQPPSPPRSPIADALADCSLDYLDLALEYTAACCGVAVSTAQDLHRMKAPGMSSHGCPLGFSSHVVLGLAVPIISPRRALAGALQVLVISHITEGLLGLLHKGFRGLVDVLAAAH
jgi:hypothetical protein